MTRAAGVLQPAPLRKDAHNRRVAFQEQERRQQRFFAHFARMDELRYLEQLNRFAVRVR